MAALAFAWFICGVLIIIVTALMSSLRRALLLAFIWALPFVGPLIWHDIAAENHHDLQRHLLEHSVNSIRS